MPASTTLQLASPYDFKLCREAPNALLTRAYFFQLLNSGFGFVDLVQEKIEESGLDQNKLPNSFIEELLNSQELIPEFFFFFSKVSLQSEMSSFDFDIYTDIVNISYDQGGLLVMECFRNQIYVLCTSSGVVITDHCHDLDLGLNGLLYYRSSHRHGDFESAVYRKETGQLEPSGLAMNTIENFVYNGLNLRRDYLPFQFEPYLSEGEFEFLQGRGDLTWLKDALKNNEINWVCAPWLVNKYHSNDELVIIAIQRDYKVFSLLKYEQQNDREVLKQFSISAPFEYFYACFLSFRIPSWPLKNQELVNKWTKESTIVSNYLQ